MEEREPPPLAAAGATVTSTSRSPSEADLESAFLLVVLIGTMILLFMFPVDAWPEEDTETTGEVS